MNDSPRKVILLRFLRSLAALVVAFLAAWIVTEGVDLVPDQYDFIVVGFLAPALLALEKYLRDGGDAPS